MSIRSVFLLVCRAYVTLLFCIPPVQLFGKGLFKPALWSHDSGLGFAVQEQPR